MQIATTIRNSCQSYSESCGCRDSSEEKKTALKAEALTIRAYFHWLAAVKFTKAYDPATADSEKSIAYVLETQDIKQPIEQLTQKEV